MTNPGLLTFIAGYLVIGLVRYWLMWWRLWHRSPLERAAERAVEDRVMQAKARKYPASAFFWGKLCGSVFGELASFLKYVLFWPITRWSPIPAAERLARMQRWADWVDRTLG